MAATALLLILIATTGPVLPAAGQRGPSEVHVVSPSVAWTIAQLDTMTEVA